MGTQRLCVHHKMFKIFSQSVQNTQCTKAARDNNNVHGSPLQQQQPSCPRRLVFLPLEVDWHGDDKRFDVVLVQLVCPLMRLKPNDETELAVIIPGKELKKRLRGCLGHAQTSENTPVR